MPADRVWLETATASRSGKELKMNLKGVLSGWKARPFCYRYRRLEKNGRQGSKRKKWALEEKIGTKEKRTDIVDVNLKKRDKKGLMD